MTGKESEGGYILAGVTVVTLILSITAAGLLSAATTELRRAHQLEREVAEQSTLRGIVRLVATDLSMAERARLIDFSDEVPRIALWEHDAAVSVVYETAKLDLNAAPADQIEARALELGWSLETVRQFVDRIVQVRREQGRLGLVDDAIPTSRPSMPCLHQSFTVFGGSSGALVENISPDLERRITPGVRLAVTVEVVDFEQAVTAVLLMLGNTDHPAEIMDLRYWPVASKGACNVAT